MTKGPSIAWSESAVPAGDHLLTGVLAGLFSELTVASWIVCKPTMKWLGRPPLGLSLVCRSPFPCRERRAQGQPHASVITALESIRVC